MVHLDPPPAYVASSSGQHVSFGVTLHEDAGKSLLVTITPPREPQAQEKQPGKRTPLDLCLVIDVSGSMGTDAPAASEDGRSKESMGLSVLDVVKHACRTILSTMQDDDRLSIVTFSDTAEVRVSGYPRSDYPT
jgi:von Willebrand factor type A domain